jgi:hypothetical protein
MLQSIAVLPGVILVLVGLATLTSKISQNLSGKGAERAARRFCRENNLQFMELSQLENHYVLYYQKQGELYYSKFHFESDGAIIWIKYIV